MAFKSRYTILTAACAAVGLASPVTVFAEDDTRRIEEMVVTAEKRQSTVSDTSISITAFSEDMLDDMGIQSAEEMVNFIPATVDDGYDIRIRGVGRNFRALGGDPGVATYYNGVYSEDYAIAASEGALYDLERIEVLRGPQGTLYGRNSIGGAINYISNKPSYTTTGQIRAVAGNLNSKEIYGFLSGPIIADRLAYRLVGSRRDRDGSTVGIDGSEDTNSIADQNLAIALNWRISEDWEWNVRYNDRKSDRIFPNGVLVSEGTSENRDIRSTDIYALGLRDVPFGFTGPTLDFDDGSGGTVSGIYRRQGVDASANARPNRAYGTNPDVFDSDIKDLNGFTLTNNRNDETFDHNGVQTDLNWDINETTSLKYIGGWSQFDYTFFDDLDNSTSTLTQYHQKVLESVENNSHELQFLWQIGDNLQLTSGAYFFDVKRNQVYSVNDDFAQGRFVNAANYGFLTPFVSGFGPHIPLGTQPMGTFNIGTWDGVADGQIYAIDNTITTEQVAVYTQGTYTFNENWALTLGIRWAEDKKTAEENRAAYVEDNPDDPIWFGFIESDFSTYSGLCGTLVGSPTPVDCELTGLTNLAAANMLMTNAFFVNTFDPANPIIPTCALDDPDCATPLRLQGIPYSYADSTEGDNKWSDVTWRVNLDWSPTDTTLMYFSATTGYRAGGYSLGLLDTRSLVDDYTFPIGGSIDDPPFSYDEENVIAYEVGYKGTLFEDRLQLFGSIYLYDYDGYQDQLNALNPTTGEGQDIIVNADSAENLGFELEGIWLATDSLTIGGNYSHTRTEYTSNVFVVENDDPSHPTGLFEPETVNLKGNDLKRIPRDKAVIYSWYDWVFSGGTLTAGGAWSYTGAFWQSGIKRDLDKVPARDRLDLYATWRDSSENWYIRAFVDNVTDEGSSNGIGTGTAGNNWNYTSSYLYPRYYGLEVRYTFRNI